MKFRRLLAAALLATVALAGCVSSPDAPAQTPAQAVYLAQGAFAGALNAAVAYAEQPMCRPPAKQITCSDPEIVVQLRQASEAAYAALTHAQRAVRTPGFGEDRIRTAITIANESISAFSALVHRLGGR